jgi:hypothetical protein
MYFLVAKLQTLQHNQIGHGFFHAVKFQAPEYTQEGWL